MRRNVVAGVAGMTADANSLVNYARNAAQKYLLSYDDDIPVEQLVQRVCDMKQGYTQFGGLRPFGVSILYAGYDAHHTFQLYQSDPSGNYSGWKATCIGMNNGTATSLLKQDYKDGMSVADALGLAARVLSKTMDTTAMESDKRTCARPMEILTVQSSLPCLGATSARRRRARTFSTRRKLTACSKSTNSPSPHRRVIWLSTPRPRQCIVTYGTFR